MKVDDNLFNFSETKIFGLDRPIDSPKMPRSDRMLADVIGHKHCLLISLTLLSYFGAGVYSANSKFTWFSFYLCFDEKSKIIKIDLEN